MSATCETCRFFRMHPKADETWKHGDCRLKPPFSGEYWPTPPKDGWCGEHQPRKPEQPKEHEPGTYWARLLGGRWEVADWNGVTWFIAGHGIVDELRLERIGPRIEPPAETDAGG